jgi:hypothetical protein
MTTHKTKPQLDMAPCIPKEVRHDCATCLRQRLPGQELRGMIDATVLVWSNGCPMRTRTVGGVGAGG